MATRVRLFVSAGPDQEPAREHIGRLLAEFPINVGWVIKRTPDVDSVAECHLFVLLIGSDIWAPVGLELWWARRTEKELFVYASETIRTPAGQVFLQENSLLDWRRYADLPELRRLLSRDLSRFLLSHPERYGVTLAEAHVLHAFLASIETPTLPAAPVHATGAGGGGVILAPGKDEPPGVRLIQDKDR